MTTASDASRAELESRILQTVKQFWGYESLRPLQAEAVAAGIEQRDSLVGRPLPFSFFHRIQQHNQLSTDGNAAL